MELDSVDARFMASTSTYLGRRGAEDERRHAAAQRAEETVRRPQRPALDGRPAVDQSRRQQQHLISNSQLETKEKANRLGFSKSRNWPLPDGATSFLQKIAAFTSNDIRNETNQSKISLFNLLTS